MNETVETNNLFNIFKANELPFGMYYFPMYFRRESPAFHVRVLQVARENFNVAVQAPRGSAKSTALTFIKPIHGICFKQERFIILVQNTFSKAAGTLENIKMEFRGSGNEKLRRDFGITLRRDTDGDAIFVHPDGTELRMLCKGADQIGSIRGERFGPWRPTLILIDDIEDDIMVANPERRLALERQVNEVLKYAGESGVTKILVDGTILHDDSLLAKLLEPENYKHFTKLFYKARYEEGGVTKSIWPEKWSVDDLNEMEREDPEAFAKEMQGDPSSGSMETILRKDFRYWRVENNCVVLMNADSSVHSMWDLKECSAAIAVDLAWEDEQISDFSALVPGLITPANDLLIDDYITKKGLRPDEFENLMFDMSDRYYKMTGKRVKIGFEKAKLEKVMKWFLKEAQKRRGIWLWLCDVSWGTKDKVERILARVGNRYAQHNIYHKRGMGDLENQLIRLRSTKHDDIADCVGMLPELLAYAPGKKKKPQQPEDEFMWWRRKAIEQTKAKPFYFGQKNKRGFGVPYVESYR